MGRSPSQARATRSLELRTKEALAEALTVRGTRRVRKGCTLTLGNVDWEQVDAFLAGQRVTVARTLADPQRAAGSGQRASWVEHDVRVFDLGPVDLVANGKRKTLLQI